jgi:hypothetical protein
MFVALSPRRGKVQSSPAGSDVSIGNVSSKADSLSSHGSSSDAAARESACGSLDKVCFLEQIALGGRGGEIDDRETLLHTRAPVAETLLFYAGPIQILLLTSL